MVVRAEKSPILAFFMSLVLAGCETPSSADRDSELSREGRLVFSDSARGSTGRNVEARGADGEGWGVVLEFFSGAGHVERARQRRDQISRLTGRSDVFVRVRTRGSVIVLGSYPGPDDQRAQRDLKRMQSMAIAGRRPYERAYLAPPPPPPPDMGKIPELNLLSAKRLAGARALYTLQVGVFESPQRERAKRGAERYALELRQQGEMAFYYHGPTRSMVTIGIFGEEAYDAEAQRVSLGVQALQRRFPLNLLDGEDEIPEPSGRAQPSMLVRIPG